MYLSSLCVASFSFNSQEAECTSQDKASKRTKQCPSVSVRPSLASMNTYHCYQEGRDLMYPHQSEKKGSFLCNCKARSLLITVLHQSIWFRAGESNHSGWTARWPHYSSVWWFCISLSTVSAYLDFLVHFSSVSVAIYCKITDVVLYPDSTYWLGFTVTIMQIGTWVNTFTSNMSPLPLNDLPHGQIFPSPSMCVLDGTMHLIVSDCADRIGAPRGTCDSGVLLHCRLSVILDISETHRDKDLNPCHSLLWKVQFQGDFAKMSRFELQWMIWVAHTQCWSYWFWIISLWNILV